MSRVKYIYIYIYFVFEGDAAEVIHAINYLNIKLASSFPLIYDITSFTCFVRQGTFNWVSKSANTLAIGLDKSPFRFQSFRRTCTRSVLLLDLRKVSICICN
jgi:hypothetical protein